MERDFLGLTVKQEVPQETKDSVSIGGSSAMQWSFPNKVSGPQFLSFQGTQEDKPKTGFESLASTGLVTITTTDSYDSGRKTYSNPLQKNMIREMPGGIRYTVSNYPAQQLDANSVRHPEVRVLPVTSQTNQTVSVAMSNPVQKAFLPPVGQHLISSSNAQIPGEVSRIGTVPAIPAGTSVVGTTDLRNGTKSAVTAAQLTIFYAGSVCVFDDVSPEKAQAIMLLAGNQPLATSSAALPAAPAQTPTLRSSILDGLVVNQLHSTTPCISSPIAVASHSGSQPAGASGRCTNMISVKSSGMLTSPCSATEPSKVLNVQGSFPNILNSSAVPQARKASLARFLERRRGRIVSTSPYARNQSPEASATASGSTGFGMNSESCRPVPATS